MSNKDPKRKKSFADRIKDSGKEFLDGVKEEVQEGRKTSSSESTTSYIQQKKQAFQQTVQDRVADTSTPEEMYYSTTTWFWTMIFVIIICISFFFYGLVSPKFLLVGLLALIAMPFLVVWCLIHMVPTIKIFGFTIFDRKQLSLRRQLSVGKEIARFFTREFIQESPEFAFFLFLFSIIFLMALLFAFLPG
jgi:hypothetical protein